MFTEKEFEFFNSIAFSNFSANFVIITDYDIKNVFPLLVLFNKVTLNDIYTNIHLYNYKHIEYLNFLKTLLNNPPIDMNTHIIKGEDSFALEMHLYNDQTNDIILIASNDISKVKDVLPICWKKLKSNGCLIIKGVKHESKNEIQTTFASFITDLPSNIRINICLIENTENLYFIKKPCYAI